MQFLKIFVFIQIKNFLENKKSSKKIKFNKLIDKNNNFFNLNLT